MERMKPTEFKSYLETRTRVFSVAVLKALDVLPKKNSSKVIANQLGRSATSIGANYHEANRAESGDDFRHKLSIALKEANETRYWIQLLADTGYLVPSNATAVSLVEDCVELIRLLTASIRTAKQKKSY